MPQHLHFYNLYSYQSQPLQQPIYIFHEKCKWVVEEAGFDSCIDYKSEDVAARITELAPKGLNIYFDNVGGPILEYALGNIAQKARVVMCGGISS